jgi:predicted Zn-dependent peptidase
MGSFIGELTQAFEISEKVKILCQENLPFQFYDQFQAEILACTTEDILQLANKYLNLDEMLDIRVG